MSLAKWAIFGLLALLIAEVLVFILVASQAGILAALVLAIGTSFLGAAVIRRAGGGAIRRARSAVADGTSTGVELDGTGVLTVVAGVLLLLPGFLTDIFGALLLIPASRRWLHVALRRAVGSIDRRSGGPSVVDLEADEWRRVPEERIARAPPDGRPPDKDMH